MDQCGICFKPAVSVNAKASFISRDCSDHKTEQLFQRNMGRNGKKMLVVSYKLHCQLMKQLFETGKEGVYACYKCQPLVPEVTYQDNGTESIEMIAEQQMIEVEVLPDKQSTDVEVTVVASDEGPPTCSVCQKSFPKNAQLQAHMRNHRAERRFVCTYCNKAFSQSNNLRAHLRIHTNERPYKCSECGKAFTQVTNLNNHVRLHTGERPFVCTEPGCNKAYAQVTNLNQHRKRHLMGRVESNYNCPDCGESFSQRHHMHTHRREVHGESRGAPRRFVCKLCDLTFLNERLLQKHVEEHLADTSGSQSRQQSDSELRCVFKSCGARFSSPHEHTEHLLTAHQLRVLASRTNHPPRRGRPPKTKQDQEQSQDPLAIPVEIEETNLAPAPKFKPIKIVNGTNFLSTLKIRGMFQ